MIVEFHALRALLTVVFALGCVAAPPGEPAWGQNEGELPLASIGDSSAAADEEFLALAAEADAVVIAVLGSKRSYWSQELIYTEYTLTATATLHGVAPPTLTVIEEGGEVGEIGLVVSDTVTFDHDVSYALVLRRESAGSPLNLLDGRSGVRRLETADPTLDPVLRRLEDILEERTQEEEAQ